MKSHALAAALAATLICAAAFPSEPVYRVETEKKVVALTFDDGPHPKKTAAAPHVGSPRDRRGSRC